MNRWLSFLSFLSLVSLTLTVATGVYPYLWVSFGALLAFLVTLFAEQWR